MARSPRWAVPSFYVLVGAGEGVEQGGLAAVGVARQGHLHGAGVVGAVVIGLLVVLQLVDVVLQLAALPLQVGGLLSGGLGTDPPGRPHLNLGRVVLPQGQLIPPQGHLQGVPQGGDLGHLHIGARGQAHVHQPPLHRARLVAHGQNHAALSGGQVLEGAGLLAVCIFHGSLLQSEWANAPFRSILLERRWVCKRQPDGLHRVVSGFFRSFLRGGGGHKNRPPPGSRGRPAGSRMGSGALTAPGRGSPWRSGGTGWGARCRSPP